MSAALTSTAARQMAGLLAAIALYIDRTIGALSRRGRYGLSSCAENR